MELFMNTGRIQKIQLLGFDPHVVYYHGTTHDFSQFTPSERGAFNYGIYLTNNPNTASSYAGASAYFNPKIYPVHVRLKKGINVFDKPFSKEDVLKMLNNHPDKNEHSFQQKVKMNAYADNNFTDPLEHFANKVSNKTGLDAINYIVDSGIYKSKKQAFEEITKHTGYNHIFQDRGDGEKWLAVWHSEDVRGVHAKFEKEHTPDLMEGVKDKVLKYLVKSYIKKMAEKKKEEIKQRILDTVSESKLTPEIFDLQEKVVEEDAPAANVTANVATFPVVTLDTKVLKSRLKKKLCDISVD